MSLREWLIIVGALIILGVVLDGFRRMYRARQDSLEIARGMGGEQIGQTPIDDDYNAELPNGGARVPGSGDADAADRSGRDNETGTDSGDGEQSAATPAPADDMPLEPLTARDDESVTESFGAGDEGIVGTARVRDPAPRDPEDASREASGQKNQATGGSGGQLWRKLRDSAARVSEAGGRSGVPSEENASASAGESDTERPPAGANRPEAGEVIVINVHCRGEARYSGSDVQAFLEACGLEFGDLGIYHRHEEPDTRTPVQFSVASAVAPGTLRPEEIETLRTPGLSFFMSLPGPAEPVKAFDFMLVTAQTLSRNLGGELRDENHSVMTSQTIEHGRQRIREFERKRRSVKA